MQDKSREELFHDYFYAAISRTLLAPNPHVIKATLTEHLEKLTIVPKNNSHLEDETITQFKNFVAERDWANLRHRKQIINRYCSITHENPINYYCALAPDPNF